MREMQCIAVVLLHRFPQTTWIFILPVLLLAIILSCVGSQVPGDHISPTGRV